MCPLIRLLLEKLDAAERKGEREKNAAVRVLSETTRGAKQRICGMEDEDQPVHCPNGFG